MISSRRLWQALAAALMMLTYTVATQGAAAVTPNLRRGLMAADDDDDMPEVFDDDQLKDGAVVLHIMGVCYTFLALAIVCDEYFVPALETMAEVWGISDDVAGATLMAAGGSAPELFTSFIGTFFAESNVGFGTIVGSAVFNVLFVFAMCALYSKEVLQLTPWPLFRDATYYLICLVLLAAFFEDKAIEAWEAAILFSLYLGYVTLMYFNERLHVWAREKWLDSDVSLDDWRAEREWNRKYKHLFARQHTTFRAGVTSLMMREVDAKTKGPAPTTENRFKRAAQMVIDLQEQAAREEAAKADGENAGDDEDEGPNLDWPSTRKQQVLYVVLAPLTYSMYYTIPNKTWNLRGWYYIAFFLSIIWIGVYSYFMVGWATIIGKVFGIPSEIMGLTFLAAGTSVPDLLSSVIVARQGLGDMAVSSSIGSNIFDVTVGLPLPWFFKALVDGTIDVESDSLFSSLLLLVGMLAAVVITVDLSHWRMSRTMGSAMFVLYFIFMAQALATTDWDADD